MSRVVVTGMGIISALGRNVEECHEQLRSGKTGIKAGTIIKSNYSSTFPFGEVSLTNVELANMGGWSAKNRGRTDLLAKIAFTQAIQHAGLSKEDLSAEDTAFISASTVGGMSDADTLYNDIQVNQEASAFMDSYSYDAHLINLSKEYGIKGFTATINTACSSSANAIMLGARLIKSGRAKRAIVGGSDSLGKFTINGFNALRILSEKPCMPFDENRSGLTLGEASAYMVLESEEFASNKIPLAVISGHGNANDAYHPSSISPDATGVIESMNKALRSARVEPNEIDYINAHGTGTENNDISELKGMKSIFGNIPPFNATKSYTGHTLAAAGAVEAIFSILSLQNQELFPSLNCSVPINEYKIEPITEYQPNSKIKHLLSNSFGFSGSCTSLVISQP